MPTNRDPPSPREVKNAASGWLTTFKSELKRTIAETPFLGDLPAVNSFIYAAPGWHLVRANDHSELSKHHAIFGWEATAAKVKMFKERLPVQYGLKLSIHEPDLSNLKNVADFADPSKIVDGETWQNVSPTTKGWTPEAYAHVKYVGTNNAVQPFVAMGARSRFPSSAKFQPETQKYLLAGLQSRELGKWTLQWRMADDILRNVGRFMDQEPAVEFFIGNRF